MAINPTPVPFREAEDALARRGKTLTPSNRWTEVEKDQHAKAFTVARSAGYDIIGDVADALQKNMAEGKTFRDFAKDITPVLQDKGWWGKTGDGVQLGSPRRLKTIYQTNMRTAAAQGRWAQIERQAAIEASFGRTLYLRYVSALLPTTRATHRGWHNTVLPWDDPWWDSHFPPNEFGCKCTVQMVTERDLRRYGMAPNAGPPPPGPDRLWTNPSTGEEVRVPHGIGPGWDYHVGRDGIFAGKQALTKLDRLPAKAGAAAAKDLTISQQVSLDYRKMVTRLTRDLERGALHATGDRLPVGIMTPKVVKNLTAIGQTPASAPLWISDKQVAHMLRDGKTQATTKTGQPKALPLDDVLALPERMGRPEAVYWDKDTESVVYIFASKGRDDAKGKYAMRIRWSEKKAKKPVNMILTGGWEARFGGNSRYIRLDE